jgi:hypothetical protein
VIQKIRHNQPGLSIGHLYSKGDQFVFDGIHGMFQYVLKTVLQVFCHLLLRSVIGNQHFIDQGHRVGKLENHTHRSFIHGRENISKVVAEDIGGRKAELSLKSGLGNIDLCRSQFISKAKTKNFWLYLSAN